MSNEAALTNSAIPAAPPATSITCPQSKFRRDIAGVTLNPAWVYGNGLYVYSLMHSVWNFHGFVTNAICTELDGSSFIIDETDPNTITGRSPHHEHSGEFWIICMGYAPLHLRHILSRYARSNEVLPPANLLIASADAASEVLRRLQAEKTQKEANPNQEEQISTRPDQKDKLTDVAELQNDPGRARGQDLKSKMKTPSVINTRKRITVNRH
jgi:hypothetical protein